MARLMDTLLIALSSLATACSLFPTRQTACSQDRPCPSGQYCRPDTATCEASPAVEDMAISADLDTSPDMATPPPPGMIFVPGGQFTMGDNASPNSEEKPAHPQTVASFYLDDTEVTVAAYTACVDSGNCSTPTTTANCTYGVTGKENHPINCINWNQADNYCTLAGKRLPTEIEFEYAIRGSINSPYAWGSDQPLDRPNNQLCWKNTATPQGTCPVTMFMKTLLGIQTQDGAHDLMGNVYNWTGNQHCRYPLTAQGGQNCVIANRNYRGVWWGETSPTEVRSTRRVAGGVAQSSVDAAIGFRCARSL